MEGAVVGIDFGSKNIRAAFFIDGDFKIVNNCPNLRLIPTTLILRNYDELCNLDNSDSLDKRRECTYRFQGKYVNNIKN